MTCPFLQGNPGQVLAGPSAVLGQIDSSATGRAGRREVLFAGGFASCPVYQRQPEEQADGTGCPFLCESLMQYCGAALGHQVRALQRTSAALPVR